MTPPVWLDVTRKARNDGWKLAVIRGVFVCAGCTSSMAQGELAAIHTPDGPVLCGRCASRRGGIIAEAPLVPEYDAEPIG
jgi:hypothetical protein